MDEMHQIHLRVARHEGVLIEPGLSPQNEKGTAENITWNRVQTVSLGISKACMHAQKTQANHDLAW